jgi:hypothetical protein
MSKKLLKEYIKLFIHEQLRNRKLYVWDLDDTLVITNSRVHVEKENGDILHLTPAEYAVYEREPGDTFDYSDFEGLKDPKAINWTTKILKRVIEKYGTDGAVILTARGSEQPAREFFKLNDIPEIPIVALGDSHPERKAQWIKMVALKFGYDEIEFFDDSKKNIDAVRRLKVPGVNIIARLIKDHH